jgi:hypothetical protein
VRSDVPRKQLRVSGIKCRRKAVSTPPKVLEVILVEALSLLVYHSTNQSCQNSSYNID